MKSPPRKEIETTPTKAEKVSKTLTGAVLEDFEKLFRDMLLVLVTAIITGALRFCNALQLSCC